MIHLEELHIKNLRIRTVNMGKYLLDNLPSLRRASYWILDMSEGVKVFKTYLKRFKARGLKLEYKEC